MAKSKLFKDRDGINHRNMGAQLENLSALAEIVKTTDLSTDARKRALLGFVPKSEKPHAPHHVMCDYDGEADGERVTEKRICRCMYYFNCGDPEQEAKCATCGFPWKKRNGNLSLGILDYEVPMPCVVEGVGGIDILAWSVDDSVYAVEMKPENSSESLARMIAEILTYCELAGYEVQGEDSVFVKPAICFFENSKQHRDFEKLKDCDAFIEASAEVTVFVLSYGSDSFRMDPLKFSGSERLWESWWTSLEQKAHRDYLSEDDFEALLLKFLKKKYESCWGVPEYQRDERSGSKKRFYLRHLEDNFVCGMSSDHFDQYMEGDGGEMASGKIHALRSSAAMTFNLLGNSTCVVKAGDAVLDAGRYAISYEYKPASPLRRGRKANLDALLVNDGGDTVIACEMKMLEWLTSTPKPLVESYVRKESYRYSDVADVFVGAGKAFRTAKATDVYDAPQMFRHLVALYNACREGEWPEAKKLVLLNCVWEPNLDEFSEMETKVTLGGFIRREHNGFAAFKASCKPLFKCFKGLGIELFIEYRTAADLVGLIERPEKETALLQRYC